MIVPTVGRQVWYRQKSQSDQPMAATIAYVLNDRMVNLQVIDRNGVAFPATSVTLVQDGDSVPDWRYCEWVPFQKGQAARQDAAEAGAQYEIGTAVPVSRTESFTAAVVRRAEQPKG